MADSTKIYGRNPVRESIEGEVTIEKIFFQRDTTGEFEVYIRNACRDHNIPLAKVPSVKLDSLARDKNHQGVVAMISPVTYRSIEDVFTGSLENLEIAVLLDGITDVRNMGAIARTALGFGVDGLVLTTKGASVQQDAIKTSSGALLKLPVCREKNIMVAIEKLQQLGFRVLVTDLQASDYIDEYIVEGPVAIVLGAEDKGVSQEALRVADGRVKVHQSDAIDSLNVSVAAGVVLSELYKKMKL